MSLFSEGNMSAHRLILHDSQVVAMVYLKCEFPVEPHSTGDKVLKLA